MLNVNMIVTQECNLACKYCYMSNEKAYMSKDVVDLMKKYISDLLYDFKTNTYSIVFFGGEPLLNWDIIKYIVNNFKNDSRLERFVLLTNGIRLTEEKKKWLTDNNVGISVSFDGLWNESNRVFTNENPSLDFYLKNKELFEGISPKIMVSPKCIDSLCDNYDFFIREFNNYFPDFSLVRDDIWTENDIQKFKKELRKLTLKQIENINNGIETLVGFYSLAFSDIIFNSKHSKRHFGCFAGVNGLAVFPNGDIYPCGRFGSAKRYKLYELNKDKLIKFENVILSNPQSYDPCVIEDCKECDIYQWCNAGCSFQQIKEENGELIAKPIKSICDLYKVIYGEFIYMWNELKDNIVFKRVLMKITKSWGN